MRMLRGWLIAAVLLVAAWLVMQFVVMRPRPIDVRIARAERGKVEATVSSTKAGAIRSRLSSNLSTDAAGTITAIHAREGVTVKKGRPLLSIDRRDADAARTAAQKELAVLEALVLEAAARHRDAVREHKRIEGLRSSGDVTESQVDQAATLKEALAAAKSAADARVEAQKAAVIRAQIAVDKCDILAPFDGVVAQLFTEVGEWAVPGKVVMRLIDTEHLYVRAELDEVDLGPLKTGMPVRIVLDPYKDLRPLGRITRIAPFVSEVQEQNRTLEVDVEFSSGIEGLQLKPGTSADVEVILRERDGVLRIPSQALMEGNKVLIAGVDGRARAVPLKIGMKNWEYAEVLEGLAEGDAVIVSLENEKLKDGVLIRLPAK